MVGELLVSTSRAYPVGQSADKAWAARKRLAVLMVMSDVLHADKFHAKRYKNVPVFQYVLKSDIAELVESAAEAIDDKDTALENRLQALINFWASTQVIGPDLYKSLRERFADGRTRARGGTPVRKRTYKLPDIFGERNLPWYQQPASYMIDPLIEHPDRAIDTTSIRAERPGTREATPAVRAMLDDFFDNIDLEYMPTGDNPTGETKKYKLWYDSMGQLVKQNKITGETKTVCNGYGWSPKFCRDMQDIGLPSKIVDRRAAHIEKTKLLKEQRDNERLTRISPALPPSSPRRRRVSSSASDRGSDSDRPSSRDSADDQYRQRRSSRDEDRLYDRRSRFDGAQGDRQPNNQYARGSQHQNQRWNNHNNQPQASRNNYGGRGNNSNANFTHGFPQAPQAFNNAPPFHPPPPPPPPPMQGQYTGPPFPQPPQYFPGGPVPPPPPPPPNYNGTYNPPSNMVGQPGNTYFQGGNHPGYGNQANNNPGYNNGSGYGWQPQHQRGFGGGHQGRGGNRGGNRGDNRGSSRGGDQGQWSGRGRY
jgi:hypothetical protein